MPSGWCDLSVRMGLPGAADDLARTVYAKVKSSAPVVAVAGGRVSRVEWYEESWKPLPQHAIDTRRYHEFVAMTLRLSDEQTEALPQKAEAEHRSTQQVALATVDACVHQATPMRRQSVPVTELMTLFQDLPPMSADTFRADQDRYADAEAYFDAYGRGPAPEDGE